MKSIKKSPSAIAAVILAVNLLSLAISYISTYHAGSSVFSEISGLITTLTETALPLIAAASMLAAYSSVLHFKLPLLHALMYSLAWLITSFAEYFIEHSYAGYTLPSALLFSFVWGLLMAVAMYAELVVLFFIIIFASRIFASRRLGGTLVLDEHISKDRPFDFSDPIAVGVFSASTALFLWNLGMEIANTVNFILECAGLYTVSEIFYILFRYVFILGALLLSHFLAFFAKNKLISTNCLS